MALANARAIPFFVGHTSPRRLLPNGPEICPCSVRCADRSLDGPRRWAWTADPIRGRLFETIALKRWPRVGVPASAGLMGKEGRLKPGLQQNASGGTARTAASVFIGSGAAMRHDGSVWPEDKPMPPR